MDRLLHSVIRKQDTGGQRQGQTQDSPMGGLARVTIPLETVKSRQNRVASGHAVSAERGGSLSERESPYQQDHDPALNVHLDTDDSVRSLEGRQTGRPAWARRGVAAAGSGSGSGSG